jgi:hypothetical protein
MPFVPHGVVSSFGKTMLLPVDGTLSVSGSSASSPSDSVKMFWLKPGGIRKPPSAPSLRHRSVLGEPRRANRAEALVAAVALPNEAERTALREYSPNEA